MSEELSSIIEVQQYVRAIHIMAMLLIGFGYRKINPGRIRCRKLSQ